MNKSTVLEWQQENSHRSYPLIEGSLEYVTSGDYVLNINTTILDANLFYEALPDQVLLTSINTTDGTLTINVSNQSPFVLNNYSTATYPAYIRNDNNSLIVIGDVKEVPADLTFIINAEFEPCVALEVYPATKGVSSVTIQEQTLTGDITLTDGYQLTLLPTTSAVNIEVGRNEGHPLPCIPILGVTNDCASVASFINGASPDQTGGIIKFVAGKHTKIYSDTDKNRIYIGYDFEESDLLATSPGQPKITLPKTPFAWYEGEDDSPDGPPDNIYAPAVYFGLKGTMFRWSINYKKWIGIVSS